MRPAYIWGRQSRWPIHTTLFKGKVWIRVCLKKVILRFSYHFKQPLHDNAISKRFSGYPDNLYTAHNLFLTILQPSVYHYFQQCSTFNRLQLSRLGWIPKKTGGITLNYNGFLQHAGCAFCRSADGIDDDTLCEELKVPNFIFSWSIEWEQTEGMLRISPTVQSCNLYVYIFRYCNDVYLVLVSSVFVLEGLIS